MTDKEKLDRLFDAALKDTSDFNTPLTRSYPALATNPAPQAITRSALMLELPEMPPVIEISVAPPVNAGLDGAASKELGAMLDDQHQRLQRKRRRGMFVSMAACLALTGGIYGWFIQEPGRVQALRETIKDIRSVGDIKGMVANYSKALDKIAVHSKQIDQSTESMGVSSDQANEKDPNLDAEMKIMMGGKGKTTGERNQQLQRAFGNKKQTESPAMSTQVATADTASSR